MTHAIQNISKHIGELATEYSDYKMSEISKINLTSVHSVIANESGSSLNLHSQNSANSVTTFLNDNVEGNCQERVADINASESENHDRSELAKEPSKVTSKILQYEKVQTSEIKERVMGFLTKYAKVDEASGCGQSTVSLLLKKDCVEEKEIVDLNADDNALDVLGTESTEDLSVKNNLNCDISSAKSAVTSSATPKFHSVAELKKLAESQLSRSLSCELPIQNLPVISNQQMISSKQVESVRSQPSFQTNNCLSTLSYVKPVHPSVSTYENGLESFNHDTENSCIITMTTLKSESHYLQEHNSSMSNMCKLEPLNYQFKTNANFQNQNDQSESGYQSETAKENELNTHDILSDNLFSDKNNSVGTEMKCTSKTTLHLLTCSIPSLNDSIYSLSRNNACVAVNSLISPWEKMSFQPQTTPSITSPILSSKSSNNNCTSIYTGYSECRPVIFQSGNTNGGMPDWSCSVDCVPKAKNCGTTYNSGQTTTRGINCLSNANVQNVFDSRFKSPEKSASSKYSVVDGENVYDFSVNNADRNSQKTFRGNQVEYCNGPPKGNLKFESVNNGSPFKVSNNNPFMKRAPVQSIGLFKQPVKTTVHEVGNLVFKPVLLSKNVVSSIEGKVEDSMENSTGMEKCNLLNQSFIEEPSQFPSQTLENESNRKYESSRSLRNVCDEGPSVDIEKPNQAQEVIESKNNSQSECLKPSFSFQGGVDVTPFQFTLYSGKPKSLTNLGFDYNCRVTRKSMKQYGKTVGQYGKGFLFPVIDMKENNNANSILEKDTSVPFVPVCGLDTYDTKNMDVLYHNITLMKEYIKFSPEELRFQFYTKFKYGPFKFCASSVCHCSKITKSQETQTDEDLTCKKPDLGGIWRVLECPVCLDVVLPPVYQCQQGHNVCVTCWNKVTNCPLCKRHKSNTRNYMAEALVEQIPLPCRYHIEGCKESVQPTNKVSHEEMCVFRTYQCPVPLCNNAHSYQNMCKHFKNTHKSLLRHKSHSVAKGEKFYDVLYKETLSETPIVCAFDIANWGLFFLRDVTVNHSTALFMQIMPAVSDQAAYFYHLEVSDHHDCRQECYKGRVFPIGKPSQEIVNQEEYLCLDKLIMKTIKKTTPLKIAVRIWQLKPAFTFSTN